VTEEPVDGFAVGDEVWCLAWVGKAFTVVETNPADGRISIQAPSATDAYGAQVDLFPDTRWMLTHEPWDQVWHWPDRAGETYETVVDRFMDGLEVGRVLRGYYFDTGIASIRQGKHVAPVPKAAMTFRVHSIERHRGRQVWTEPVAPVDAEGRLLEDPDVDLETGSWRRVGPAAPLRVGMRAYRWSLSFGELVLNWSDFLPA
jgi:hypothetical protein